MKSRNIPTLFPHNHASNLLLLSNGDVLCTWFGGSCEGKADISIHLARLSSGAEEWEKPVILSDDTERSEQNPILFEISPGVIWLIYTAQIGIHQDTAVVRWRRSEDYGQTWSEISNLFSEAGIFVRNPPVVLENGDILLPAYYCLKSKSGFLGEDYSVIKRSSDMGLTWSETVIDGSAGLVHMSLVETKERKLVGFFRNRRADFIYSTVSEDGGKTWKIPFPLELPNNNSSIQCTKLKDDSLVLIFNDVNKHIAPPKVNRPPWFDKKDMDKIELDATDEPSSVWGVRRNPLVIARSVDGGLTWERVRTVITKEGIEGEPEFSYPSIKQAADGTIHVSYTFMRQFIRHEELTENFE